MHDYRYLIAPILGWLAAQAVKVVLSLRKDGITLSDAFQSGGMPSSHTSLCIALSTVVAFNRGFSSVEFAIVASLTAIIIYDSLNVRRTVGEHTSAVKHLANTFKQKLPEKIHDARGHNMVEVIGGFIIGVLVGIAVNYLL